MTETCTEYVALSSHTAKSDASMAAFTIQVAPTTEIGSLAADRLSLAIERCPAAFLGMATGKTPKV
jgi:hypothetical protein